MSSFLGLLIRDLRPVVLCRDWGSASALFALCPVDGGVGGTLHRCVACSVMCAQRMFPVRLAVGAGGALMSVL